MEMIYDPERAGKFYQNNRGNQSKQRKYHLTSEEIQTLKERHIEDTKEVSEEIKKKAGKFFFNPYRKGIYWAQLQALYLLGSNEWHELKEILEKTQELSSTMPALLKTLDGLVSTNQWDRFRRKTPKSMDISRSKDVTGRIQENFVFMQRLTCHHPSGYKLRQACAAIDLKKVSKEGFSNGLIYYRLSTYSTELEALPIRNFQEYDFSEKERKYYTYRFIGTIITKDSVYKNGKEVKV